MKKTILWEAPLTWRGGGVLRLAAQVQARTQQLAAEEGQDDQLLGRTHGVESSSSRSCWQLANWQLVVGQS